MDTFISGQSFILEKIATGASLSEVLTRLVQLIESQADGMMASILLLDEDGIHLRHGAAPSLPKSYVEAIDGASIGPNAGSCGTAAYLRRPVVVTDTQKDPLWKDYRELAAEHGLRACWSSPIMLHTGQVLGTFAIYYQVPRGPLPNEQRLSEIAMHIASIAIENRRTEQALRKSEERSRAILRAIPDSMFLLDSDFTYLECQPRSTCQVRVPEAELIGKNMRDVLPPHLAEKFARCFQKASESGELQVLEYDFPVGGQTRYNEARVLPTSEGKFLAIVRDITDSKRSDQALRESEERFRVVAMATRDGIYDVDLRTHAVWRNETYQQLFSGGEPTVLNTEWWAERIHPADRERVRQSFTLACETASHVWSDEYSFRRLDGTYAMVVDRGYILFDDTGLPVRLIGAISDITERRLAEDALQKREDELRRSNAYIRRLAGKILTAQEEERRRISRELHDDLNQKVAALSIGVSSIKQKLTPRSNGLSKQLEMIHKCCIEISEGIRRLSHDLHPAVLEHVGLVAALRVYLAEFSRLEGIQVTLAAPDKAQEIPPDAAVCLYRIAQESLRNVVKHSGVNCAEVTLSVDKQAVHLQVADDGLGFDPAAARNNGGVGLASMEERVRLMQGSFRISSRPGGGSKLQATIPLQR
jgi:PAS domain S-box-containing protein